MNTDRWMRASDQDRERAAEVLRDAYAVGRLSRDEFDERTVAVYSARTWGELSDLTADLPAPRPDACLPSDLVVSHAMPAPAIWRLICQLIWTFGLVLMAGLAGRVIPAAVWVGAILVPFVLVFPFALNDISRAVRPRRRAAPVPPLSWPGHIPDRGAS